MSLPLRSFAEAAPFIAARVRQAVLERGRCDLVLAGGNTPRFVYERLASGEAGPIPWERVRLFWGDERFVPHDHPASNYRLARESLLERLQPPGPQVFPVPTGEAGPEQAARRYERTLRELLPGRAFPAFDLVLLGLGADGHTASLFPGGPEGEERTRWCLVSRAPEGVAVRERITLSLPALSAARAVAFLVAGEDKRAALQSLLDPALPLEKALPAQRLRAARSGLQAAGELFCFTDLL